MSKSCTHCQKAEHVNLQILSRVVEQSPNSVVVTDQNGIIEYVNPNFESLTGYTKEEVIGKNQSSLKSGENQQEVYEQMWQTILSGKRWSGELCNRKKNGELFCEYVVISSIKCEADGKTHFIAVKTDITERKKNEEALRESERKYRELSLIDNLTQLYNSRHFQHQINLEIKMAERYKQPLTIVLIDIDNFKNFNDTHGHVEGR